MVDTILGIYPATIGSVDKTIAVYGDAALGQIIIMAVSDAVSVIGPVVEC